MANELTNYQKAILGEMFYVEGIKNSSDLPKLVWRELIAINCFDGFINAINRYFKELTTIKH